MAKTSRPVALRRDSGGKERGASLIGLLLVVVILGGLAAVAIVATNSETSLPSVGTKGASTTTLAPGSSGAASDISAAASTACRANYEALNSALQAYEAINGHAPSSIAALQSELKDPVSSRYYTFGLNAQGQVTVATKGHPAGPGDANCAFAA